MAKTKSVEQDINITLEDSISINEFIDKDYMEYSLYVLRQRAIPSYIDGFKVVHRKLIYSALNMYPSNKKIKVAELGASLSSCVSGDTEIIINGNPITIERYYNQWDSKDFICAFDELTKLPLNVSVLNVIKNEPKELFLLELENGSILEVTGEHLIMTKDSGWKKVCELTNDDEVLYLGESNGCI